MKRIIFKLPAFVLVLIVASGVIPVTLSAASVGTESALRSAVAKGGSHKLTKNISLSERLVIPAGKTVTLDLNGKTLSRGLTAYAKDGSVKPGGEITGGFVESAYPVGDVCYKR